MKHKFFKMAEKFIGRSNAKELKRKVKKDIFVTKDIISDGVSEIETVCINYPKNYMGLALYCRNEDIDTDEKKRALAIKNGIIEYYYFNENNKYVGIKKQDIKRYDCDFNTQIKRYLIDERKRYYVNLLKKAYDKKMAEMLNESITLTTVDVLAKYNVMDFDTWESNII